jgi:hypothetical protein
MKRLVATGDLLEGKKGGCWVPDLEEEGFGELGRLGSRKLSVLQFILVYFDGVIHDCL